MKFRMMDSVSIVSHLFRNEFVNRPFAHDIEVAVDEEQPHDVLAPAGGVPDVGRRVVAEVPDKDAVVVGMHDLAHRMVGVIRPASQPPEQRPLGNRIPPVEPQHIVGVDADIVVGDGDDLLARSELQHLAGLMKPFVVQIGAMRCVHDDRIFRAPQGEDRTRHRRTLVGISPSAIAGRGVGRNVFALRAREVAIGAVVRVLVLHRGGAASAGIAAARTDILPVGFQDMDIAVHIGRDVAILLRRDVYPFDRAAIVEVADLFPVHRDEPLVRLVHLERCRAAIDLPHLPRSGVEGIDRLFIGGLEQQPVQAADRLADREGERCDRYAVVALRRLLRREQMRHLREFAVVGVVEGIQFDGVQIIGGVQELVVPNHRIHIDMLSRENLARDAAARQLLVSQCSLHDMADQRVVVVPIFRMPDARGIAAGIEVVKRIEQPVVRNGGNIAHGKRYGHIDVVRGIDERFVAQSLVVAVARIDRERHLAERGALLITRSVAARIAEAVGIGRDFADERLPDEEPPLAVAGDAVDLDLHLLLVAGLDRTRDLSVGGLHPRAALGEAVCRLLATMRTP